MTLKNKLTKRLISAFLCIAVVLGTLPISFLTSAAVAGDIIRTADASTLDGWKEFFPVEEGKLTTENAGGVWTDKTVLTDASAFSSSGINMTDANGDKFLVALSAIGSNMTVTGMATMPTDTVIILDMSNSIINHVESMAAAANKSIKALFEANPNNRVAIVSYNNKASVLLPLGSYTAGNGGNYLTSSTKKISIARGVKNKANNQTVTGSVTNDSGTYTQAGIKEAIDQLESRTDSNGRLPVVILLTDGEPTYANFDIANLGEEPIDLDYYSTSTSPSYAFLTQLTMAYLKQKAFPDMLFYTIGVGNGVTDDMMQDVINPGTTMSNSTLRQYWQKFNTLNHTDNDTNNDKMTLSKSSWVVTMSDELKGLNYDYLSKIKDENGKDINGYFPATSDDLEKDMEKAFDSIVNEIINKSVYTPTLVEGSSSFSGYISFVDKIGEYMNVTDFKGILLGDKLYSGEKIAETFAAANESDSNNPFGTAQNPTELGVQFINSLVTRLSLKTDTNTDADAKAEAWKIMRIAWQKKQISYSNEGGNVSYSNWFGWLSDAQGKYIMPWYEGMEIPADAVFINKSHIYLGEVVDGADQTDMMYATVRVRERISTGEEEVNFAIPASLIPTVTYKVDLNSDGTLNAVSADAAAPIRLVYEAQLDSSINRFNASDVVSKDYLNKTDSENKLTNLNSDGSVNFYSNKYETKPGDDGTYSGYNRVNTYSYFRPSRENDRYYYQQDADIYVKTADATHTSPAKYELYNGAKPNENGEYYHAYTVYTSDGIETHYHILTKESVDSAAGRNDGSWYIKTGTVRRDYAGYRELKSENRTNTLSFSAELFTDIKNEHVDNLSHSFVVGATLGNNGKLTLVPETGIKLSKALAYGAAATEDAFEFTVTGIADGVYPAYKLLKDGSVDTTVTSVSVADGKGIVSLKAGEIIYIGGMKNGDKVKASEKETDLYTVQSVNGAQAKEAEITVEAGKLKPVEFVNKDRGTGGLVIEKVINHPYGSEFKLPDDISFNIKVTLALNGAALADKEYSVKKSTDAEYSLKKTDASGSFTFALKHSEKLQINGLPEGARAKVEELSETRNDVTTPISDTVFEPVYYVSAEKSDSGEIAVVENSIGTVKVENTYPRKLISAPANIKVNGTKTLIGDGRVWKSGDSFTFKLQKWNPEKDNPATGTKGDWEDMTAAGAVKTISVTDGDSYIGTNTAIPFSFDKALENEIYTEIGAYSYRAVEVIPAEADRIPGVTYDRTVHSFRVTVTDFDLDGKLEIDNVAAYQNATEVKKPEGAVKDWTVSAAFANTYAIDGTAIASIDITKTVTNKSGSPNATLSGFTFGLYGSDGKLVTASAPTDGNGFTTLILPTFTKQHLNGKSTEAYTYTLKEIAPSDYVKGEGKWQYSEKEIKVTVILTDESSKLTAKIYTGDTAPANPTANTTATFNNEYVVKNATVNMDFVSKQLENRILKANEFEFELWSHDHSTDAHRLVETKANAADGSIKFSSLSFDKVGRYCYYFKEVIPAEKAPGMTYDESVYQIFVNVVDDNGELKATIDYVDDINNTKKVIFKNSYTPDPIKNRISGLKKLNQTTGRPIFAEEFTFIMTEADDAAGNTSAAAEKYTAKNDAEGNFVFDEITYTAAGKYYYLIEENHAGQTINGITYSTERYVVAVEITYDNAKGIFEKSVSTSGGTDVVFTNTYNADPVKAQISGIKVLGGRNLLADDVFEFELWNADTNWKEDGLVETVQNAGRNFSFKEISYNTVKDYRYIVKEKPGNLNNKNGITNDTGTFRVLVRVTDNGVGQLNKTVYYYNDRGALIDGIVFRNTYTVSGTANVTLKGTKELSDRELAVKNEEFEFELYKTGSDFKVGEADTPYKTSKNNADRELGFELSYESDVLGETFYYTVKEKYAGTTNKGVTYSTQEYYVTVYVFDDGNGGIDTEVTVTDKDNKTVTAIDYLNTYSTEASALEGFSGKKDFEGLKAIKAGDFKFDLYETGKDFSTEGKKAKEQKENEADGSFTFSDIKYSKAGTYYYVIKENDTDGMKGVTYDKAEYRITVKVTDDNEGRLVVSTPVIKKYLDEKEADADKGIYFKNIFTPEEIHYTIKGEKNLENRTLKDKEFKFELYSVPESFKLAENQKPDDTAQNNADKSFAFKQLTFKNVGDYFYIVKEDTAAEAERITYDDTVYYVTVEVTSDENGILSANAVYRTKIGADIGEEKMVFNNIYTPRPEDLIINISVDKRMENKGSETMTAEGFRFLLEETERGDKLTAETDENGDAEFTLTFTEDDIDKLFTYSLTEVNTGIENVKYSEKDYFITVQISLNSSNELVARMTMDDAPVDSVAAEFVNEYDYTPPTPPTPPVAPPTTPDTPVIPDTSDNTKLSLWLALLFVSGTGLFAISLYKRKRVK